MAGISASGVGSGLDIESIVSQLMAAEAKAPTQRLDRREAKLQGELSAVGSIKSALSKFQSSLSGLTDATSFAKRKASSGDSSLFSATASSTASAGSYGVEVQRLAQAQKLASAAFADKTEPVGTGTLTFQFGTYDGDANTFTPNGESAGGSVTIDATDNSLEGIRDAVNEGDFGVRASIVNDGTGDRLVFASAESGAEHSLRVTVSGDGDGNDADASGLSALAYDPTAVAGSGKNMTETVAAQDALATIDGIEITSSSNTLSEAIEGVTIDLKSADVGNTQTLTVSLDKGSVSSAVKSFVDGYNDLIKTFNVLTSYDAETGKAGILIGDAAVRGIESQLRNMISSAVPGLEGGVRALADLGIKTERDGTLSLDQTRLQEALDENFDDIKRLFAAVGTPSDSLLSYRDASDATEAGTYAVEVTQLATQGLYTGGALTNSIIDATNDTFALKVDGIQSGTITLSQADYTGNEAQLAAEIQAKINGDEALGDAGASVVVTYDGSGFTITSERYGSESTVEITKENTALGFGAGAGTDGVDVAGTIGGVAATGAGQTLTGTGAASGLRIDVRGGATGSRGSIVFSRGVADRLDNLMARYLDSDGFLGSRSDSIKRQIDTIGDQRERLMERLERVEQRYRNQFTQLDVLMAQMQTTSDFLTNQLSALPGAASKS